MHSQQIEGMLREDGQQFGEHLRRIEPDAGLDGERDLHGIAQRAENGVHALGVLAAARRPAHLR